MIYARNPNLPDSRDCSPSFTFEIPHAFGVDDIGFPSYITPSKILFLIWIIFTEQRW